MRQTQETLRQENTTSDSVLYIAFELSNPTWKLDLVMEPKPDMRLFQRESRNSWKMKLIRPKVILV